MTYIIRVIVFAILKSITNVQLKLLHIIVQTIEQYVHDFTGLVHFFFIFFDKHRQNVGKTYHEHSVLSTVTPVIIFNRHEIHF